MSKLSFSIGILSWKGYDSLENSLNSYKKNGLSNMTNYKYLCLPEYTEEGIKIAKKYNYKPILARENLGILGGFKKLAEEMPKGPILLLENDLELIENKNETFLQLQKSIRLMNEHRLIQVRLRSRKNPGEPFVGLGKYKNYWSDNIISKIKRILRPLKARKLIGTSVYCLENPDKIHYDFIKKICNGFYIVPSSILTWANLAILVDRDVYLEKIIKKAEQTKSKKNINGFKNIEIELNNSWWRKKKFKILITPGLFKHNRLSYRGY
tara:strand:- start:164 stop:964 length:801 start_codon:yes stop_codon:yes gene_type:complete